MDGEAHYTISFEELDRIENEIIHKKESNRSDKDTKRKRFQPPGSKFDPNLYTLNDWMQLGLSEKQSNVVLKFTQYGIHSNEELEKIFVIPEELFLLIKDSTYYPVKHESVKIIEESDQKRFTGVLELNGAKSDELVQLSGIGPYYSKKIVEYRERLGGYVRKEQLLELWKFDAKLLEQIEGQLSIDLNNVRKLNINQEEVDKLANHPYISYKVANSIVNIRKQHGDFKSIEDIKMSKLIDEELFVKLKPYITI